MVKKQQTIKKGQVVFFQDRKFKWYWHLLATNGNLIAQSAQGKGFEKLQGATKNLKSTIKNLKKYEEKFAK